MNLDLIRQIADTVLYEGYMLYPYRASAVKNQQRFNFGVLMPRDDVAAVAGGEASSMRTECLIEGDEPTIDVRVRFLQLVSREVFRQGTSATGEETWEQVASLEVGDVVHHTWQEAIEREVIIENLSTNTLCDTPRRETFTFEENESTELLESPSLTSQGETIGQLTLRQSAVSGTVTVRAEVVQAGLTKISVEIENTTPVTAVTNTRGETLPAALLSTHTILTSQDGEFVSSLDPPESFASQVADCNNLGTFPVLVGNEEQRDMLLSSPIILYDDPQIAPESDGDFFDGLEMDEMLALRVMTLTDDEKHQMQHVDARARQILERTEALPPEHWQKLHGAIRGLKSVEPK